MVLLCAASQKQVAKFINGVERKEEMHETLST